MHVAVKVDRAQNIGKFYFNGNHLTGSDFTPVPAGNNTDPVWLGATRLYGTPHAPGFTEFKLNEIEIFNVPLADSDILSIAAAPEGKCKTPQATPTPTNTPLRPPTSTPTITPTLTPTARPGCDLAITKNPTDPPVIPGVPFAFEVAVTNVGNVACQPTTTVTDNIPLPGFTLGNFFPGAGWSCTAPPGIICTNSTLTLQPGQKSVVFDVIVTAAPGITIQNCATVTTNQNDVNSANNTACYTVGITGTTPTPTSTPAVTGTPTPTPTRTRTPTPTRTPKFPPACVGDCNTKGAVTVDDILTMVNIALGNEDVSTCIAGDASGDGMITVDEILTAVNNALNGGPGCGAAGGT